ncbi:MAG: class I SAM-dependent methyltransferase [Candidatus Cloacimonetes bacterium]|nr:class I SAM-dependent methyltransferase [Candidatus Cloacimonadota bacterium]
MNKKIKKYTEANRKAWNEAMPKHRDVMTEKWDKLYSDPNFIFQKDEEFENLNKIGIKGKRIAHLSCNNGLELMSLKRLGAKKCVGFDISDEAISDAKLRAEKFQIDCQFVQTDVLEIDEKYYGKFDMVYITVGALIWIPDLNLYFEKASKLLVNGGILFIYEHHPFASIFPFEDDKDPLKAENSYFTDEIYIGNEGIDYYGNTTYESASAYEFSYTISKLLNILIRNGFCLTLFNEYDKDIALSFARLEKADIKLPLSYILIARKK